MAPVLEISVFCECFSVFLASPNPVSTFNALIFPNSCCPQLLWTEGDRRDVPTSQALWGAQPAERAGVFFAYILQDMWLNLWSPKSNNIHLGFSLLANDQESFCSLTNKALFSWLMLMTFRLGFFPIHTSMWIPQNWHSFFGGDCLCFCKQSCWDVPCLSQVLIYETKAIHSIFKNYFAFPSPAHSLA